MMTILLLYFIPIIIIFICCYLDMDKGETVEEYLKKYDSENIRILTFLPVVNIFISIVFIFFFIAGICCMIDDFIFDKIKNIKK